MRFGMAAAGAQSRPAAVGDPPAEGGELRLIQGGQALVGDLLHQPGETDGSGKFKIHAIFSPTIMATTSGALPGRQRMSGSA